MATAANNSVRTIIYLFDDSFEIVVERSATMAQLRSAWHQQIQAAPSVAFFTPDQRRHLPDDWTLARAQLETGGRRVMELKAVPKAAFHLRVFGFQNVAVIEAALHQTPAALREEMARALGLLSSEFRLFMDNEEVDQRAPFSDIPEGSQLLLDPEMVVQISRRADSANAMETTTIRCHASTTVRELRQMQQTTDSVALLAERPQRILQDSTRIAHLAASETELEVPIQIITEEKQTVFIIQPSAHEHMQQEVAIPMSVTPLVLADFLNERFQMTTQFRLVADGQPLDASVPLAKQGIATGSVIQLDPVQPRTIRDNTSSPRHPMEKDNTLLTEDPLKVVLHDKKKLHICRLPKESTFADLHAHFCAWKGSDVKSPTTSEPEKQQRVDLKPMSLVHLNKVGTRVEVQLDHRMYHCWFERPEVTFSDVIVNIGHQAEISPRQLFRKQLFCRGCSRKITRDEEEFQEIPAACCRVRSLKLSDRRVRDMGSQTGVQRSSLLETEPLNSPQMKVAIVKVVSDYNTQTVSALSVRRRNIAKSVNNSQTKKRTVNASSACRRAVLNIGCSRNTETINASSTRRRAVVQVGSSRKVKTANTFSSRCNVAESVPVDDTTAGQATRKESLQSNLTTDDVSSDDSWMTAAAKWLWRSLTTARLLDTEAELPGHTDLSFLVLVARNPTDGGKNQMIMLKQHYGVEAGEILDFARLIFRGLANTGTVLVRVSEILNNGQRSLHCFDEAKDRSLFVSLEGGRPTEIGPRSFVVHRYLSAISTLPVSPFHTPVIDIETNVLMQLTAGRQLEAASPIALHDPNFVAYIQGVRCGAQQKIFWRLVGGAYVNTSSGAIAPSLAEVPCKSQRHFIICLLRRGDQPPYCPTPVGRFIEVFCRAGIQVNMERGRLHTPKVLQTCDIERWVISPQVDVFDLHFTDSARWKDTF